MKKTKIFFFSLLTSILLMCSCAQKEHYYGSAFYNFEYDGEQYRIRSVSSEENAISFNELVGKDFVAKDYDQDGLLDEISLGEKNLSEAQKIYEYTLTLLESQTKLQKVNLRFSVYQELNSENNYEIKSYTPGDGTPFNQFKVIKKKWSLNPEIIIGVDQQADGSIDEIVKGSMSLEEIQILYSQIIEKGLEKNQLIEINKMIIVKD